MKNKLFLAVPLSVKVLWAYQKLVVIGYIELIFSTHIVIDWYHGGWGLTNNTNHNIVLHSVVLFISQFMYFVQLT